MSGFYAILLAAGASTRFGAFKLSAPFRGRPLLAWSLDAAAAAPVEAVLVVTDGSAPTTELIRQWSIGSDRKGALREVHVHDAARGLSASLHAALGAVPDEAPGVLIFLGDMPLVPHAMAAQLIEALDRRTGAAPMCQGQRGHPVLLGRPLLAKARQLEGDRGAGALLHAADVTYVETQHAGVLFDVDTPADLRRGWMADGLARRA